MNLIRKIPEVAKQERYIDSLTDHKKGLTLIDYDEGKSSNKSYYEIHVGYSSDARFETFFNFKVDKATCDIQIENDLSEVAPLKEWENVQRSISSASLSGYSQTSVSLPYSKKVDVDNVAYQVFSNNISGAEEFLCGEKQ